MNSANSCDLLKCADDGATKYAVGHLRCSPSYAVKKSLQYNKIMTLNSILVSVVQQNYVYENMLY